MFICVVGKVAGCACGGMQCLEAGVHLGHLVGRDGRRLAFSPLRVVRASANERNSLTIRALPEMSSVTSWVRVAICCEDVQVQGRKEEAAHLIRLGLLLLLWRPRVVVFIAVSLSLLRFVLLLS
jgi:hypothetical protein